MTIPTPSKGRRFRSALQRSLALGAALSLAACGSVGAQIPSLAGPLTPSEAAYVEQTASVVYRRATVERMNELLFSDSRGHGVCVRSPAGAVTEGDYTLLILQRRITEDYISQADDDVLILRSAADAAPCRALGSIRGLWLRAS